MALQCLPSTGALHMICTVCVVHINNTMNRKPPSTVARKKLTIKPYKAPVATPPDHFAKSSTLLIEASRAILHKRHLSKAKLVTEASLDPTSVADTVELSTSREELYRLVESLCLGKQYGSKLLELLGNEIKNAANEILSKLEGNDLNGLLKLYDEYSQYIFYIRNIFLPLDRSEKKNIFDMGKTCFRELVLKEDLFHQTIVPNLLQAISTMRVEFGDDLLVNKHLSNDRSNSFDLSIKKSVQMMRELQFFDEFESLFLDESRSFYTLRGSSLFATMTLPSYILHINELLSYNATLCGHYFNCTKIKLANVMEACLVKSFQTQILGDALVESSESPFYTLLDESNRNVSNDSPLSIIFELFRKINATDTMEKRIIVWGRVRGGSFLIESNPIPKFLELHEKLACIATIIQNKSITKTVMETVLNQGSGNKVPQALAKQFNYLLSKKDQTELDSLTSLFTLFTYLVNKDTFGAHYRRFLGRRLLHGSSISLDIERSMLGKLKGECGAQYTAKLEGMYNDIELAVNLRQQYYDYCKSDPTYVNPVEFEPTVLTTGYWQQSSQHSINVPHEFQKHMNHYTEYYTSKYKGRRIVWQHSLGFVNLKAKFPESKTTYQISLPQNMALVLLQFNSQDGENSPSLTVSEVATLTNLPTDDVIRCLISLSKGACDKSRNHRLITHQKCNSSTPREEKQGGILPEDTFVANIRYKSKSIKMKIPLMSTKHEVASQLAEEETEITQAVARDRGNAIDAAIVRLLKTRKVIKHQDLLAELMNSGVLKFSFQPSDVKKRIESLIERDYLERNAENLNIYHYLA